MIIKFHLAIIINTNGLWRTALALITGCGSSSIPRGRNFGQVYEIGLKRIFGPKRDENWEWRRLHEELHSDYRSPIIIRVIKSRRLRWAGHVARMMEGSFQNFNRQSYRKSSG